MGRRYYGTPSTTDTASRRVFGGQVVNDDLEKQLPSSKPKSKIIINILMGMFAICLLFGGIFFGIKFLQEDQRNTDVVQLWDDIRDVANDDDESVTSEDGLSEEVAYSTDPMDRLINWKNLLDINTDVACWMYIPDTNIDYPIMQEQTFGKFFYLNRDIYKKEFSSGSLFIPCQPEGFENKDAHLLVFGHNMRNGSMFSQLSKYKSKDFYLEHPYVYVYYQDRTEKWEVYSPYHTNKYDMIYNIPYEHGTKEYSNLLVYLEQQRLYEASDMDVTTSMNLLSLSTCDKTDGTNIGRFVVNCVLVDTKYLQ